MSLLNAKFPLYSIRAHIAFRDAPPYRLITTKYGEYVLDYLDKDEGDTFAERRLSLLTAGSGYKLYPLKERFDSLASVINSTKKIFVDARGKVVRKGGDGRSFRKCCHAKVIHFEQAFDGSYRLFTRDHTFIAHTYGTYVEYLKIAGGVVLLNVMDTLDNRRHRVLV